MNLINKKDNIFGDEIAFVEQYDFSTANLSEENRIKAIEMFKGREDIVFGRMEHFKEDLENGKNPFLDIDKILKEKEDK